MIRPEFFCLFFFCFTDPPYNIFCKIEKQSDCFSILFLYFSLTHASTILEFMFVCFIFSTAARLIKLPPVTALSFPLVLINQRTNGPVNAHLISWPSKAQNIQNLKNIW